MLRNHAAHVIATAMTSLAFLQCGGASYDGTMDMDGGKLDDGSSDGAGAREQEEARVEGRGAVPQPTPPWEPAAWAARFAPMDLRAAWAALSARMGLQGTPLVTRRPTALAMRGATRELRMHGPMLVAEAEA
jgi:hypothetical protein